MQIYIQHRQIEGKEVSEKGKIVSIIHFFCFSDIRWVSYRIQP